MPTLEQGQRDLDAICQQIDKLCKDKLLYEQANQKSLDQIEFQINSLINKQAELTDSIYGVIQYIKEQQQQQMHFQKYQLSRQKLQSHYEKTGKMHQFESADDISMFAEEMNQIDSKHIDYGDITNFFPYLKNIEDQVMDLENMCDF